MDKNKISKFICLNFAHHKSNAVPKIQIDMQSAINLILINDKNPRAQPFSYLQKCNIR